MNFLCAPTLSRESPSTCTPALELSVQIAKPLRHQSAVARGVLGIHEEHEWLSEQSFEGASTCALFGNHRQREGGHRSATGR
jgi:hypothetical protein